MLLSIGAGANIVIIIIILCVNGAWFIGFVWLAIVSKMDYLNFGLFLTYLYHIAWVHLEYSKWVVWTNFMVFLGYKSWSTFCCVLKSTVNITQNIEEQNL